MSTKHRGKKRRQHVLDEDNATYHVTSNHDYVKRMKLNSSANLKGSVTWFKKQGIDYNRDYSSCIDKEDIPKFETLYQSQNTPNKHSKRFANSISIQLPHNPTYLTRYQRQTNTLNNEIIDINRLNAILSNGQLELINHINQNSDHKNQPQPPLLQFKTESKTNKVGRFGVTYCSLCGETLYEDSLHPNMKIVIDEKHTIANRLDIQLSIACQESRMKIQGFRIFQLITALPYSSNRQFWKYVTSVYFTLDTHKHNTNNMLIDVIVLLH